MALGPVDSLHDVPNPIWIMGSRNNYTQRAVGGTADDKKYCTDVEYALQNKSRRPGAPANVRLAVVLTPYVWQAKKFVHLNAPTPAPRRTRNARQ